MKIDDWFDFFAVHGFCFMTIVTGTWVLPQLPERANLIFCLSIVLSSIFISKKAVEFLVIKLSKTEHSDILSTQGTSQSSSTNKEKTNHSKGDKNG